MVNNEANHCKIEAEKSMKRLFCISLNEHLEATSEIQSWETFREILNLTFCFWF